MAAAARRPKSESGFTLVEMAVAIAILAVGLGSLLSLQTRYIRNYLQEESRTRAALYGQYLLSGVELTGKPPEVGRKDGELLDALKEAGYFNEGQIDDKERKRLEGWNYHQEVTSIDVPPFEDVLRRVEVTVAWGDAGNEQFGLVYFMRSLPKSDDAGQQSASE